MDSLFTGEARGGAQVAQVSKLRERTGGHGQVTAVRHELVAVSAAAQDRPFLRMAGHRGAPAWAGEVSPAPTSGARAAMPNTVARWCLQHTLQVRQRSSFRSVLFGASQFHLLFVYSCRFVPIRSFYSVNEDGARGAMSGAMIQIYTVKERVNGHLVPFPRCCRCGQAGLRHLEATGR